MLLRRRDISQAPECDQGLCPDARRRVRERRDERARIDAVQLAAAVGQGSQRELADGGVFGELPQRRVRTLAVELLEGEEGRGARVGRLGAIGRQRDQGPGRLRRLTATDDLALAGESSRRQRRRTARRRAGPGRPRPGAEGTSRLRPGGVMHAMNPT